MGPIWCNKSQVTDPGLVSLGQVYLPANINNQNEQSNTIMKEKEFALA
jgi:hypothetical protein